MIRRQAFNLPGILCCGLLLAGCIAAHDRVAREELPASWLAALQPGSAAPDVSGSYLDSGDYTHEYSRGPGHLSRGRLTVLLFPETKPAVAAEQVRLVQHGLDQLEIAALTDGRVVASKTVAIETDRATGAVRLPRKNDFGAGGNLAAATDQSTAIVLYKGNDGVLYLQSKSLTVGVVGVVVPMKVSAENWGRWILAP
jgi:hypothetical protein